MKIRKLEIEDRFKVIALIKNTFPDKKSHLRIITALYENNKDTYEWVCIHRKRIIAYIIFTKAYKENEVCGHLLGNITVHREFVKENVGDELIKFALRQKPIKDKPVFALRNKKFLTNHGFIKCENQYCSIPVRKDEFLTFGNNIKEPFRVDFESEYTKK